MAEEKTLLQKAIAGERRLPDDVSARARRHRPNHKGVFVIGESRYFFFEDGQKPYFRLISYEAYRKDGREGQGFQQYRRYYGLDDNWTDLRAGKGAPPATQAGTRACLNHDPH